MIYSSTSTSFFPNNKMERARGEGKVMYSRPCNSYIYIYIILIPKPYQNKNDKKKKSLSKSFC